MLLRWVAKLAEESGISNVIINAGGNVRAIGDRGESRETGQLAFKT